MMQQQACATNLDASSAAALYERHAATIFAYLRLHLASLEDTEDALLEVFLAALEQEQLLAWPKMALSSGARRGQKINSSTGWFLRITCLLFL
jgi:DNA-directed RNA polymerase specialized sigma24 family protein